MHWCLIKLICTACGSPATCLIWHAVALELYIFFASCLTLLAGNFSRSTLLSFMVLDTNSSSCRKNPKKSQCKSWLFLGGYLARWTYACTALYHSSTLLNLVRRSKWVHTSLVCGLQNSSYFPQIVSRMMSSANKHTGPLQNPHSKQSLSCTSVTQVVLQAHIPGCSHTSSATSTISGTEHH